jgi:hypothetical protein
MAETGSVVETAAPVAAIVEVRTASMVVIRPTVA